MAYIDPDGQIYVPILQILWKSEYICHLSEFRISGYATMEEEAQIWRDNWAIASELLSVHGRPVQTLQLSVPTLPCSISFVEMILPPIIFPIVMR